MTNKNYSSMTVNQPPTRNENDQRQNDPGRQVIPMPYMRRPLPPVAHRIIIIPSQSDIVRVLAAMSLRNRQAMYILSGTGYVAQANLFYLPFQQQMAFIGHKKILYLSGWYQHMVSIERLPIPSSVNGVLHVSLYDDLQRVAVATNLIASGPVEVSVMFVCGPETAIQPDAPGGPRVPIRIHVNVNELIQARQAPLAPVP